MLLACKLCGSPAAEQVRGKLGPTDKGFIAAIPGSDPSSNNEANAPDTRIVCTNPAFTMQDRGVGEEKVWACDNATGWNKQDFADYTRFLWNRDHGVAQST